MFIQSELAKGIGDIILYLDGRRRFRRGEVIGGRLSRVHVDCGLYRRSGRHGWGDLREGYAGRAPIIRRLGDSELPKGGRDLGEEGFHVEETGLKLLDIAVYARSEGMET